MHGQSFLIPLTNISTDMSFICANATFLNGHCPWFFSNFCTEDVLSPKQHGPWWCRVLKSTGESWLLNSYPLKSCVGGHQFRGNPVGLWGQPCWRCLRRKCYYLKCHYSVTHFIIENQIWYALWDLHPIHYSSNANIWKYTVTQMSIACSTIWDKSQNNSLCRVMTKLENR